jgi:hypothetical protein
LRGPSRTRRLELIVSTLLAGAIALASGVPASAAGVAPSKAPTVVARSGVVPRLVNVRALLNARAQTPAHLKLPYLTRSPAALAAAKQRGRIANPAPPRRAASPVAPNLTVAGTLATSGFSAMGFEQQIAALGADQPLEPPDTQVAAGPDVLVEATNSSMSVWMRTGERLWDPPTGIVDLNQFFAPIGYAFSDPSLFYDAVTRHFFMSGFAFDAAFHSRVYVAATIGADPLGTWGIYELSGPNPQAGLILDQPKLGVNDDKVVVAVDDYAACPNPCNFSQDEVFVASKTQVAMGQTLSRVDRFQLNGFGVLPVRPLSSVLPEYLVENGNLDTSGNNLVVRQVTGDPNTGATSISTAGTVALAAPWAAPPNAAQPSGAPDIQTGDGRITSATWRSGFLWVGMADGCFPNPTPPPVDLATCVRLIQLDTTGAMPTLSQDIELGQSGDYLYYPALTTDASGNMLAVYNESNTSPTGFASINVIGQLAASPGTMTATRTLVFGTSAYDTRPCGGTNRWGDYSGAAVDPADPAALWVAGEYSGQTGDLCDWRTSIARVVFSASSPVGPPYAFAPSPIAAPGTLTANQTVAISLGPRGADAAHPQDIWLSLTSASNGGTASVGATALTITPQKFTTDSSGQVSISYRTGPAPPASGSDVIRVASQPGGDVTAVDAYSYAACPTTLSLSPGPIAPRGALVPRQTVAVSVVAQDALGQPIAGASIRLSLTGNGGGQGLANGQAVTTALSSFNTDASGRLTIGYTTPWTLPPAGGADTITADSAAGCVTQRQATDSYTYPAVTTFYFAEGFTGTGFRETLSVFMPNQSGIIPVDFSTPTGTFRVYGAVTEGLVSLFDVNAAVGPNQQVSARVTLPGPGIAERTMNFDNGTWHGSTDIVGVNQTANEWDFAEGSTLSIFAEYLSIQNPNPTVAATVTLNYSTDAGVHPTRQFTIPAATRVTVAVYAGSRTNTLSGPCDPLTTCGVGPGIVGVSVQVLSSQPIVAERPFYVMNYSFGSGPIKDGHVAFGANTPGTSWDFAEGTTLSGFNEYLTLQNPGFTAATVTLTYFYDNGVKTVMLPLNPQTRQTVIVNDPAHFGVGAGFVGVSTQVRSTQPIVAERPMYMYYNFGTGPVGGAHDVVGATSAGQLFGFAEASTRTGDNDYLSIENSNASSATVNLAYFLDTGLVLRQVTVAPRSRYTVQIFSSVDGVGASQYPIGITLDSNLPVLVEKPTYSSNASTYGATDTAGYTPPGGF